METEVLGGKPSKITIVCSKIQKEWCYIKAHKILRYIPFHKTGRDKYIGMYLFDFKNSSP